MRPNNFSEMNEYNSWKQPTLEITSEEDKQHVAQYMTKVYGWMFLGLVITAITSYLTASSPEFLMYLVSHRLLFYGLMIGELVMVGYLVIRVHKLSSST